jgi:predicted alpha/beta hydrolase family esterase
MKTALIIHGSTDKGEYFSDEFPSLSNSHWIPWLQKQLLMRGIFSQTPEMPDAYKPDYEKWKREFERFDVDGETVLIGHSCGGGFLVRWLSENQVKVGKLVLVAPWMDPEGKKKGELGEFFDFQIDGQVQERVREIDILVSDDESFEGIKESVGLLEKLFDKAKVHRFAGKGHFIVEHMGTVEFPELLGIVIG